MLALVIRVVSHQKVGVFSMQEAEAINSQVEGIESKMDGSFPLLMENVSWFQQYQEGSPVAVPNPEAPVCSQHHSAARHSNAPPDDPPPPWRATGTAPKNNGPEVPLSIHPRHPETQHWRRFSA